MCTYRSVSLSAEAEQEFDKRNVIVVSCHVEGSETVASDGVDILGSHHLKEGARRLGPAALGRQVEGTEAALKEKV